MKRLVLLLMCVLLLTGCSNAAVPTEPSVEPTEPTEPAKTVVALNRDVGVTVNLSQKIDEKTVKLLKDSGVTCTRVFFPYPFEADGVTLTPGYIAARRAAQLCHDGGLKVMAQTIWPGEMLYNAASGQIEWTSYYPKVFKDYDDLYFYKMVRQAWKYAAEDLKDICDTWLVSNEPDLAHYTGPMTTAQIVSMIKTAAKGIKEGNPKASCGINLMGIWDQRSLELMDELYGADSVLDWLGLDGYYGTLGAGAPENWHSHIDFAHERTGAPIVIAEFGYSSALIDETNAFPHEWEGHTRGPEAQKEYITACLEVFSQHPEVICALWYSLNDENTVCQECGDPACQKYRSWGLLNNDCTPKPSLEGLTEGAKLFRK